MAPSSAALILAGGAQGMVEGEIRYNVAEWKPSLSADDGTLRIFQTVPDVVRVRGRQSTNGI
jgi:hypothetical protein